MCGEVMKFPETVEEFMESYKIVDREQIYTNGVELIPIFRMKQWFYHDIKPAIHRGCWIEKQDYNLDVIFECSECGEEFIPIKDNLFNYCPNCGAKMDGGVNA